jgi:glyoxylase-like metal-dependent hydrolase (beta-lactamase superfamily II)
MAIQTPVIAEIANGVYCINEFGMDAMFLIEGRERTLLVDTGTGACDLPAILRTLTDKPFDVALTHGHVDHAGGIGWFGNIFLHPADFEAARSVSLASRQDFANRILGMSEGIFDRDAAKVVEFSGLPGLSAIGEGDLFDLGGKHVRVYETPGHTPGGLSFLIEEDRILLSGDACNPNTLMFPYGPDGGRLPHASIEGLLETARKIASLEPLYDRNYNGHVGFGPLIRFLPMPKRLTRDVATLCEGLLAGTASYERVRGDYAGLVAIAKCPTAQIQFDPDCMFEAK